MKIFITALICFSLGTLFGAFIMCLMQINKDSDYDASKALKERKKHEQIK